MNQIPARRIQLGEPGDLIAAIPYLLGFHPTNSLVVIAVAGADPQIHCTLRTDLPAAEDHVAFAHQLAVMVQRQGANAVVAVVVGNAAAETPSLPPPHHELIQMLDHEMTAHGVEFGHAVWASATTVEGRWYCYGDPLECCGHVPNPEQTHLAAASVAAGRVVFTSRSELETLLAPDDPDALARHSDRIAQLDVGDRETADPVTARKALATVRTAIRAMADDSLELDDETVAQLAVALGIEVVQDACLATVVGEDAVAAERLWLALTRATPIPHRAEPAALLATAAYIRGDGVLADLAIWAADQAQPDHSVTRALRTALAAGLRPNEVAEAAAEAAAQAERVLSDD